MTNVCASPKWPIQDEIHGTMAKNQCDRITSIQNTGLDYFGPLYIKLNKERKVWVCLFTYITVRVVQLELVEDLTSEQFLMVLRGFVTRRVKPNEIISDNVPQFKITKNTLDILWGNIISDPSL